MTSVDIQEQAIELARRNFEQNGLKGEQYQFVKADVFDFLRDDSRQYDLIILDPPAFCKSRKQVEQAARGYKDINLCALNRLKSGGLLFTCSCSTYVPAELFQKIVFSAAKDSSRFIQILKKTAHAPDHPINIYHPEGEYLKGFLCRIN